MFSKRIYGVLLFVVYVLRQEVKLFSSKNQDVAECVALRKKRKRRRRRKERK